MPLEPPQGGTEIASEPVPPYPPRSEDWYNYVLCTELHYERLRSWQLEITMVLCDGGDAICIMATGAGKSVLIYGPILAHIAAGKNAVGLAIVPTKGLADDQARAATSKGLRALALHEDSLRAARSKNRDLFAEIAGGQWSLVFLGPEMLTSKPLDNLLDNPDFVEMLETVTIDECHLAEEWKDFRVAYQQIKRFRDRLPSRIAWLAISGTIAPNEFEAISTGLGFMAGRYKLVRHAIDRPTIKYVPQILSHPVSGTEMLDLSWVIPYNMQSASEIPITIIFANTIGFGKRLRTYLTSLLPPHIIGHARKYLIRGYHGMNSSDFRKQSVEALRDGTETRILLCTDTGAFGIDIEEVKRVVVAEISKSFKTQTQRVGRIRTTGTAYLYYSPSMDLRDQTKDAVKYRGRLEPVMVDFANASLQYCPRRVACQHWGEPFNQPVNCCVFHEPDPERWRELEVKRRIDHGTRTTTRKTQGLVGPRANRQSRRPLDKHVMLPVARQMLEEWRLISWHHVRNRNPQDPAERFLSNALLEHLCIRMHVCVTQDLFRQVMREWDYLGSWGDNLYKVVETTLQSAEKMWKIMDEMKEQDGWQPEANSQAEIAGTGATVVQEAREGVVEVVKAEDTADSHQILRQGE